MIEKNLLRKGSEAANKKGRGKRFGRFYGEVTTSEEDGQERNAWK